MTELIAVLVASDFWYSAYLMGLGINGIQEKKICVEIIRVKNVQDFIYRENRSKKFFSYLRRQSDCSLDNLTACIDILETRLTTYIAI